MRKRLKICVLLCFVWLFLPIQSAFASENVVRVAFIPDMFGFSKIEGQNYYSGYNYDYLMNVAQYTKWEYDFVLIEEESITASLKKAEEMLTNGELDLLGPFSSTSSNFDQFETSKNNYGVYRYNLYSARNNYAITQDNYFLQDCLKIALVEGYTDLNNTFFDVIGNLIINIDVTYVQTHAETIDLLLAEEVDCILNLDMSINAEYLDYLSTVQRLPFHFASTKGNTELIAQLDDAIEKIELVEPDTHQVLLEKYFGTRYDTDFLFTDEEKEVLSQIDVLRVGLLADVPPYQYLSEKKQNVGISVEIVFELGKILGIPFEVVFIDSHDQLAEAIFAQEIDMIATLPADYPLAASLGVRLSNPYLSSSAYWLRSANEVENPQVLFHFVSSIIPFYAKEDMSTVNHVPRTLQMMENDGTAMLFCDPYIADYYLTLNQYENIDVQGVTDVLSEISFGVAEHIDENVLGMLNRAIRYIDSSTMDEIIYRNSKVTPEYDLMDLLRDNLFKINAVVLFIVAIILFSVVNTSRKFRDLSQRDSLTKLYNAGYFHNYAEERLPHIHNGAMILLDIDYFKDVNDNYGHHTGDEVIKLVAETMPLISPNMGIHARVGGDEFSILIDGQVSVAEMQKNAEIFKEKLGKNHTGIPVTMSVGAFIFHEIMDYQTLYKKADTVLYQVKEQGRNGFLVEETSAG